MALSHALVPTARHVLLHVEVVPLLPWVVFPTRITSSQFPHYELLGVRKDSDRRALIFPFLPSLSA